MKFLLSCTLNNLSTRGQVTGRMKMSFCCQGRREMALELVAAGVPLTLEDYKGHSPLYWAMKHIDIEFFR